MNNNSYDMEKLLYYIAAFLVVIWAIAFLAYSAGALIHILLFIAAVVVILRVIKGQKPF